MPQRQSLRFLHYALVTSDGKDGIVYAEPKPLVGAITAKIAPATNTNKLFADDVVFDLHNSLGDVSVELALATLPLEAQATLLGHEYEDGVMVQKDTDDPPFLALGFLSQPKPGRFRLVWLYKGKFQLVSDEYATATDTPAWRQPSLSAIFVKRDFDGAWQTIADTGVSGATETVETWFKKDKLDASADAGGG